MKQPIIAVINDDGIESPGLRAAVEAVAGLGRPVVIAPTGQQTGMGRSLWGDRREMLRPAEFRVDGTAVPAYHCNCSPAMIVRHAMYTIFADARPDLVVSGINYGENLGVSVTCSGTVGAALEASNYGVPAIAVSKQTEIESHHRFTDQIWEASAHFLELFARAMLARELPSDVDLLKIDVPDDATPETPWRITRLSRSFYYRKVFDNPSVDSRIGDVRTEIAVDADRLEPDSDIYVLAVEKQVSVTPLSLDLTARADFTELRRRLAS